MSARDDLKVKVEWEIDGKKHEAEVPELLSPFFDVLGVELAVEFILEWGGSPVYIPAVEHATRGGDLIQLLGLEKVLELGRIIGAGQISRIPICREFLCRYFYSKSFSKLKIARKLKISDETVRRILNGRREREVRRLLAKRQRKAVAA